ncbi:OmpA family protein [Sphingomicrobium marinum]|uniref:OmpA family protein n=1 Tax=Sphingomicrobium marinum TaxID=1227950 RepID=UPI002240A0A2|nr:OmpA family protein [Sphingomicrobium marinum]
MLTKKITLAVAASALALGGCVTNPNTGEKEFQWRTAAGAAAGALGGYLLGDLIGGRNDRTAKIIGAGIGAVAGGAVGQYMDRQQRELEKATEGTGVEVVRQGDDLLLRMPSGITFDTDSSTVKPQFQQTLNQVAQTLREYNQTYIDVLGHTDSTGSDSYNQALSERRAASVANYLSRQGVEQARMATYGYGETQLIYNPDDTPAKREANRRVEIRVVPVTQDDVQDAGYGY